MHFLFVWAKEKVRILVRKIGANFVVLWKM